MRKAIAESKIGGLVFNEKTLDQLQLKGYRFFQIKGMTVDNHYEYIEPQVMVLVPMKELPTDPYKRDIYESIQSELLYKWAAEPNNFLQIIISSELNN